MNKLKLQTRLMLLSGFLLLVMAGVGITSYISTKGITSQYGGLVSSTLPKQAHVKDFNESF